jgi:hypothetical protein
VGYLDGIWLAVLGILAAPNIIVSKKPEAKEWIDKLRPFQGWLGVASVVWGVLRLVRFFGILNGFSIVPVLTITWLVMALLLIALGLLLGINVIKTFVKDATAQAKMDDMVTRISAKQGKLGLVAVVVGLWIILANLFTIII